MNIGLAHYLFSNETLFRFDETPKEHKATSTQEEQLRPIYIVCENEKDHLEFLKK